MFYYSSILKQAESLGKKGISVISAMKLFLSVWMGKWALMLWIDSATETDLKCKALCSYHRDNYDMISQEH